MELEHCVCEKPHSRRSKRCLVKISPKKSSLCANFTPSNKSLDILFQDTSMKKDLYMSSKKHIPKTEYIYDANKVYEADNPAYEDPRDIIGEIPIKPPRKNIPLEGSFQKSAKDTRTLREQKKKLSRKYEGLITTLMDRCEENCVQLSEKDTQISKLKDKLKAVLDYNRLFADENDRLRAEQDTILGQVEEWKTRAQELETRNKVVEARNRQLVERVRQFEIPDKEEPSSAPLVEVCISCSSRQILVTRLREQNKRLRGDMQALKDLLYRLNIQLSKYQQKLRENVNKLVSETGGEGYVTRTQSDAFDSILTATLMKKQDDMQREDSARFGAESPESKMVELSGLLSAQALAPLFDAYQENIEEKENLILDYEKQFETINRKSKQVISENKSLHERLNTLEEDILCLSKRERVLSVERETLEIEKNTLTERAEKAEAKLKEMYELYEDKMSAMLRDYETVHREYISTKNALSKVSSSQNRTVPADLHERRVIHCQRLLEELKHQYSMENERKSEELNKLRLNYKVLEEKYNNICKEHENAKEELKSALKNVRLYRKAALVFRQRAKASQASISAIRKTKKKRKSSTIDPLSIALSNLHRIKEEIKLVKSRACSSLEELEHRIKRQEQTASRERDEYRKELERAQIVIEHKEGIIKNLLERVADVEELRLSQPHNRRLQGIIDTSPDSSPKEEDKTKDREPRTKLVPTNGGYYQENRSTGVNKDSSPTKTD